ncbi:MAG: GNAT family N-acetyltransferase [Burkholderiales bacterium]|nr:GNAT family N-acetyltransferase [Burkholderiales bacterium]
MATPIPFAAGPDQSPASHPVYLWERRRLGDNTEVIIRPIRPEDDAIELTFIRGLSRDSGYNRLLSARRLTAQEISRLTRIDYDREMAFVAITGSGAQTRLLGVARYVRDEAGRGAEFGVVVADAWQRKGIGAMLLRALLGHARAAGIANMHGISLATNEAMRMLGRKLGFAQRADPQDATVRLVEKALTPDAAGSNPGAANDEWIAPRSSPLPHEPAEDCGKATI